MTIALHEAQSFVLDGCGLLSPEDISVRNALGLITAEVVKSAMAVPPFANTAMDGFAVRAVDTTVVPCELQVIGTIAAGAALGQRALAAGEALRIMTGAVMPPGADSVVPKEHTEAGANTGSVRILTAARVGDCVRPPGEDVSIGQTVFGERTFLTPGHLGVLASIGRATVRAYRRVRVGVLSTGDELIEAPNEVRLGQIYDSNRHTLLGLIAEAGAEPVDLGLARDDEATIESSLRSGLRSCDAIVTSGGVSVGDFDFVKVVLDRLARAGDGEHRSMRWMQIAIKPAKPLAFGVIEGIPVFGLPGNPVSSMVSFELFARPALRKMMGFPEQQWHRTPIEAVADEGIPRGIDGKIHFTRVVAEFGADGRLHVRAVAGQASNLLRSMALSNALAIVADGSGIPIGGSVPTLLLGTP